MTFTRRTVEGHYIRFKYHNPNIYGPPKYSYEPHVGLKGSLTTSQRNANAFVISLQNQGYLSQSKRDITIGSVQIAYDARKIDIAAGIAEDQRLAEIAALEEATRLEQARIDAEQAKIDEVARMRAEAVLSINSFEVVVIESEQGSSALVKVFVNISGGMPGTIEIKWGNIAISRYSISPGEFGFARVMTAGTHTICADLV